MNESEQALKAALAEASAENLTLRTSQAALQAEVQALRALLADNNRRIAACTAGLLALSRQAAHAAAQSLAEAQSSAIPAVIETATTADEAAIASLGGAIEMQNCVRRALEATQAALAASTPGAT